MSQPLHSIEKKVLRTLSETSNIEAKTISKKGNLHLDQVRRALEWLKSKEMISIKESIKTKLLLGPEGKKAEQFGLPEHRLVDLLKDNIQNLDNLKNLFKGDQQEFNAALGQARRKGWIKISDKGVKLITRPTTFPEEDFLAKIFRNRIFLDGLNKVEIKTMSNIIKRPGYIDRQISKARIVNLSKHGLLIARSLSEDDELDALTSEVLSKELWRKKKLRVIDVESPAPTLLPGRKHPIQIFIDEVKEIFASMGFMEIEGDIIQPCFWNFDALFTPQDHPAREMQDTFYLPKNALEAQANKDTITKISETHQNGWKTGSRGWGYRWSENSVWRQILRTHTTSATIRYLADNKPSEDRVFSIGRVFRNEKLTFKNLMEFYQIEGIAVGKKLTLRDLMGLLKRFYKQLGLDKVKFWPSFFPYTEPSMQSMVYSKKLGKWVELCGMGIFRPEVTIPLGVKNPVLAWGGGLERLVMMRYGINDVRQLYDNNLGWLRRMPLCQ